MLHIDKAYYRDILYRSSFQLISTTTSVTVSTQSEFLCQWRWRQPLYLLIVTPCYAGIRNCFTYTACVTCIKYIFI